MVSQGAQVFNHAWDAGLKPDPRLTITEWADKFRILPKVSSAESGPYRSSRTPFLKEVMDCLSPYSGVSDITVMKATQVGFTEVGNNWILYTIDIAPAPMLAIFPTDDLAMGHSKQKLGPSISLAPSVQAKVALNKSRDGSNTILTKTFLGGILFMSGSNSTANYRSKSVRNVFLDDIDGFEADVDGEGDPIELAGKRTDSFGARKKIFKVSTPTEKGLSRIEQEFDKSDQSYYHVPCPLCGIYQPLEWGGKDAEFGIKFTRDQSGQVIDVWYECAHCHGKIEEHHKTTMLESERWVPTYPERKARGFQLSSLYSPIGWVSWRQIVEEFLKSYKYPELLKTWVNTRLGLPFEAAGDRPDWKLLQERCEPYPQWEFPSGGLLMTAGVDVQGDRLAVVVRSWGKHEESWLVWEGELWGDTSNIDSDAWIQLDGLLNRAYSGKQILSMAVDSGFNTQVVYNWCRMRAPRVIACKGSSQVARPIVGKPTRIDVNWKGEIIKGGVELWPIGTDTGKATLYSRFPKAVPGPGCYHWPQGTREDYFRQITAERLLTKIVKGYPKKEWVKVGPRNEALDCELLAYAAALRAGLAFLTEDFKPAPPPQKKRPAKKIQKAARW